MGSFGCTCAAGYPSHNEVELLCGQVRDGLPHRESFQKHPVLGETAHGAILCKAVDEQSLQGSGRPHGSTN